MKESIQKLVDFLLTPAPVVETFTFANHPPRCVQKLKSRPASYVIVIENGEIIFVQKNYSANLIWRD